MKNKKLLKFLLRDLNELEELIGEKKGNSFDDLEMEFLHTRISGAKRIIQILVYKEDEIIEESVREVTKVEAETKNVVEEKPEQEIKEESEKLEEDTREEVETELENIEEPKLIFELEEELDDTAEIADDNEVEPENEKIVDNANIRLGDSFLQGKSVNDLVDRESNKLDSTLSNRPIESIKTAIGINDRFQYIRELFDGKAEVFTNAVTELDTKNNIKEAVEYLQQNFEWKKNETSLKFVNLVKRRFNNE